VIIFLPVFSLPFDIIGCMRYLWLALISVALSGEPLDLLGVSTTEFVMKFSDMERVFHTSKRKTEEEDLCAPPREIRIQGHGDEPYILGDRVGCSEHVWEAKRKDEKIFVKYLSPRRDSPTRLLGNRRNLLREKFVLSIFKDSGIVAQYLTVVPPPAADAVTLRCLEYVVAMESAGEYTLADVRAMDIATLIDIATAGVEILSQFHSRGFVHGKIDARNFVFFDPEKIGSSLSLVDFAKSIPFINGNNRRHVVESSFGSPREFVGAQEGDSKSVFELEKNSAALSRRDDWFLLAELLLRLYDASIWKESRVPPRSQTFPPMVRASEVISHRLQLDYPGAPGVLLDMFEYSKTLTFTERPDYEYWTRRLERTRALLNGDSVSYSGRVIKDELVGVRFQYVDDFMRQVDMVEGMMIESHKSSTVANCPPKLLQIIERPGDGSLFALTGGRLSDNVWSAIRTTKDQVEGVIVKLTKKYWKEKFALEVYSDSHVTPAVYSLRGTSSECAARLIVMETAGSIDLEEYRMSRSYMSLKTAAEIAVRGIELLRQFHSRGFVHGDIHMGNFSFKKSAKEFVDSMRLIDLDRSVPFVDPIAKRHVRERAYVPRDEKNHLVRLNKSMLSVYELESYPNVRLSRRDDWFRFAEMMINVLILDNDLFKRIKQLAVRGGSLSPLATGNILVAKRERQVDEVPKIFEEFYRSSMDLTFEQRPPYEQWMYKFTQYLQGLE